MTYIPLDPFIDGLRQTADFLNDAVFSDDIAAMRDALELGRNKLRQAAEALEETGISIPQMREIVEKQGF